MYVNDGNLNMEEKMMYFWNRLQKWEMYAVKCMQYVILWLRLNSDPYVYG